MREACYTLGLVAQKLITNDGKDGQIADTKDDKLNFGKLIMLQGGIESRYIPELSSQTKSLMEGFSTITKDAELRELV